MPPALLEEMSRRRAEEYRLAERDRWRSYALSAVVCLLWAIVGLGCIGWSLHTTDERLGQVLFYAGLALGNGGIVFTLLDAYRRGERRGDR